MSDIADDDDYDATDALFQRGAFLRKLRELERYDESQREIENSDCQNDDTLVYESYLATQSYYDDYKHVNYRFIDFGTIGDRPLLIEQDRTVGKGGFVWDAGFVLAEHVMNSKEWKNDNRTAVVELGAGTGITGLMLARYFPSKHVHLTDLPQLQPLLEKNARQAPNVSVGVLEWGSNTSVKKFDVIIGADVVASIYDSYGLAKSIHNLANEDSRVYLACEDRLNGLIEKFECHMRGMFACVERRKADSSNKNPDVWILFASGRLGDQ